MNQLKGNKFRIHYLQAIILVALIFLGALMIIPLRSMVNKRANMIKTQLLVQLKNDLGISLSYESISPALLSSINIKNLEVGFKNGHVDVSSLRIYLNPFRRPENVKLEKFWWIERVVLSRGDIVVDMSGRQETAFNQAEIQDFLELLDAKTIVMRQFTSTIQTEDALFTGRDLNLKFVGQEGSIRYQFKGFVDGSLSAFNSRFGNVLAHMKASGVLANSLKSVNTRVDLLSFESKSIKVHPISIDLSYYDSNLTIRNIGDDRPFNLSFAYFDDEISMNGDFVDFNIRDMVKPSIQAWAPWFDSVIDGHLEVVFRPRQKSYDYMADFSLQFPEQAGIPWPWKTDIQVNGDELNMVVSSFDLSLPNANFLYTGQLDLQQWIPQGRMAVNVQESMMGYPIDAIFRISSTDGMIMADSIFVNAGQINFVQFDFLMLREPEYISFTMFASSGSQVDEKVGSISLDAIFNLQGQKGLYGNASMKDFHATDVVRLLNANILAPIKIVQSSMFNLDASFEVSASKWILNVQNLSLTNNLNPQDNLTAKGRIMPDRWSLDGLRVDWDGYRFDGRLHAVNTGQTGSAEGRLYMGGQFHPISAQWVRNGGPIRASSTAGIEMSIGSRTSTGRSLAFQTNSLALPFKDKKIVVDCDLRGIVGRANWLIDIKKSLLVFVDEESDYKPELEIAGSLNSWEIVLDRINLSDNFGNLKGQAEVKGLNSKSFMEVELDMDSGSGETYMVSISKFKDIWNADMNIESGQLDRLPGDNLKGQISLNGQYTGNKEHPQLNMKIVTVATLNDLPLNIQSELAMDSEKLQIYDINVDYQEFSVKRGLVLANLEKASLRMTAELEAMFKDLSWKTGFTLGLDLDQMPKWKELVDYKNLNFTGTLGTQAVFIDNNKHLPSLTFQFKRDREMLHVQTPGKKSLDIKYLYRDNHLSVLSGAPMPLIVSGGGTFSDKEIDLSFSHLEVNPVLLNYIMLRDAVLSQYHVVFQKGSITGNVDISGTRTNPRFYGAITARDLVVDTPYTSDEIKPANLNISLSEDTISVDRFEVQVGDTGIVYGEGQMTMTGTKVSDIDFRYGTTSVDGQGGVHVSYPIRGIYLDGLAQSDFHMTGSHQDINITGNVFVPEMKASLGSPQIPRRKIRNKKRKPITVEVTFTTGNNCTFYLPNEQVRIVQTTAQANQTLFLQYYNPTRELALTGVLPIKNGEIFYFDRSFQISEGRLVFNETLEKFDPIMEIRAETQVVDVNNEDVSVFLVYDSPVKSDFNPKVETLPIKLESEILALFGKAVVPFGDSSGAEQIGTIIGATGGAIAQAGLIQPFENAIREGLNLDTISLRTGIIENALVDTLNRNNPDSDTSDQTFDFGRILDNTSLYAGKYIGDSVFVSGSISARYLDNQPIKPTVLGGMALEPSFSLQMATPFFDIEWSYSPDINSPQSFIEDNRISLQWQLNY